MPAQLIVSIDGDVQTLTLEKDATCQIGRGRLNTLTLNSETVSRNHAMVRQAPSGRYFVYDLGSRNGTFLNGRRVNSLAELRSGDVIALGGFEITFRDEADTVATAPSVLTESGETMFGVATSDITVLVMDICNFTGLAQKLDATVVAELIADFNRQTGQVLDRAQPWSVKYIGDAVMAVWVHPGQTPLPTLVRVLQSILDIQSVVAGMQQKFNLSEELRIGAGINTGLASIGNLGSGLSSDYTALGDVVNKAFRLEAVTRTLSADVIFGEEIHTALGTVFTVDKFVQRNRSLLKGYAQPSDVYLLSTAELQKMLAELKAQVEAPSLNSRQA